MKFNECIDLVLLANYYNFRKLSLHSWKCSLRLAELYVLRDLPGVRCVLAVLSWEGT